MSLGLLALRVIVGLFFIGHGSQKLFGSFGGHGIEGTGGFFESLGMRPGKLHATAAGLAELGGGLLLALGLLTPLASAALIAVMLVAIITIHGQKGPWVSEGGYEYNFVLIAVAFAVAAVGPGSWSLDHAFSLDLASTGWGLAALAAGIVGGVATWLIGRAGARRATGAEPHTA